MKFTEVRIKLEEDMIKALDEIKEFYGVSSRPELMRIMITKFSRYVKEEKEKGNDKFKLF